MMRIKEGIMSSKVIHIQDKDRIILGKEATEFSKKNIWTKGRSTHEIIENRFAGNCRSFIFSQIFDIPLELPKQEQSFNYYWNNQLYLIKPFYNKSPLHKEVFMIGDSTTYLINPEFSQLVLIYFYKSSGYIKSIIPVEEYKKNFIVDKFLGYDKIFLKYNFVDEWEFKDDKKS